MHKKTIVILSVTSDIGAYLARHYLRQGHKVIGTYRSKAHAGALPKDKDFELLRCDVGKKADVVRLAKKLKSRKVRWDVFISCVGHPLPVLPFFKADFNEWGNSVYVNSIGQLHALHALHPLRAKKADVVLFAGGGMNGSVVNFSAYTISKIMLAKMCEFLDAENKDLNIFIVGPGWTKTKIHNIILGDKRTADAKVKETKAFLKAKQGTALPEIAECIDWLRGSGKKIASGRNFSVVYDPWRKADRKRLAAALSADRDMYKIRRKGNDFLQHR